MLNEALVAGTSEAAMSLPAVLTKAGITMVLWKGSETAKVQFDDL